MATNDVLILGPVVFNDFSPPECMPFGGAQMLAIHKLIGGQRVVDTLGPDDANVSWEGGFVGANAYSTALALAVTAGVDSLVTADLTAALALAS